MIQNSDFLNLLATLSLYDEIALLVENRELDTKQFCKTYQHYN